jgi:transcriptional regulator with XRE-family HTH domain
MRIKCNIEDLIRKSGLRDEVFRNALDVKQPQLRKIKKGESYPTVPKLYLLAKLLNCSTDDLYELIEDDEK